MKQIVIILSILLCSNICNAQSITAITVKGGEDGYCSHCIVFTTKVEDFEGDVAVGVGAHVFNIPYYDKIMYVVEDIGSVIQRDQVVAIHNDPLNTYSTFFDTRKATARFVPAYLQRAMNKVANQNLTSESFGLNAVIITKNREEYEGTILNITSYDVMIQQDNGIRKTLDRDDLLQVLYTVTYKKREATKKPSVKKPNGEVAKISYNSTSVGLNVYLKMKDGDEYVGEIIEKDTFNFKLDIKWTTVILKVRDVDAIYIMLD